MKISSSNPFGSKIDTDEIQDNAITTAKIQDNAITTAKIQDGAITLTKLAFNHSIEKITTLDNNTTAYNWDYTRQSDEKAFLLLIQHNRLSSTNTIFNITFNNINTSSTYLRISNGATNSSFYYIPTYYMNNSNNFNGLVLLHSLDNNIPTASFLGWGYSGGSPKNWYESVKYNSSVSTTLTSLQINVNNTSNRIVVDVYAIK